MRPYGAQCTSVDGRRVGYHPPDLMGNSLRHFLAKMPPPWRREAEVSLCLEAGRRGRRPLQKLLWHRNGRPNGAPTEFVEKDGRAD